MKSFKLQTLDQAAHFFIATGVVVLAFLLSSNTVISGISIGFSLGILREETEGDGLGPGSLLDILFWTIGGAWGGWIVSNW